MKKKITVFLFAICLFLTTAGCAIGTQGEASWEVYGGIRTKQISKEPAKVIIESSVIDKIVDLFTKPETKDDG